jgi:hypothetical protein
MRRRKERKATERKKQMIPATSPIAALTINLPIREP